MCADHNVIRRIPGYKIIAKSLLMSQIQLLANQLSAETEEEILVLSTNTETGQISVNGSWLGKDFLEKNSDIHSKFLNHCLEEKQKEKEKDSISKPAENGENMIDGQREAPVLDTCSSTDEPAENGENMIDGQREAPVLDTCSSTDEPAENGENIIDGQREAPVLDTCSSTYEPAIDKQGEHEMEGQDEPAIDKQGEHEMEGQGQDEPTIDKQGEHEMEGQGQDEDDSSQQAVTIKSELEDEQPEFPRHAPSKKRQYAGWEETKKAKKSKKKSDKRTSKERITLLLPPFDVVKEERDEEDPIYTSATDNDHFENIDIKMENDAYW